MYRSNAMASCPNESANKADVDIVDSLPRGRDVLERSGTCGEREKSGGSTTTKSGCLVWHSFTKSGPFMGISKA